MAANINDKITLVSNGSRPNVATVSTDRAVSATTLICNDLSGWDTATAVHFITYKLDSEGKPNPATQSDWKGIVSGNNITNVTLTGGVDNGQATGDKVVAIATARWAKDLAEGLLLTLGADGILKNDSVGEDQIKTNSVGTSELKDDSVTSDKLAPTKSSDAGWTLYDHGTWKEYRTIITAINSSTTTSFYSTPTLPGGKQRKDFFPSVSLAGTTSSVDSAWITFNDITTSATSYSINVKQSAGTSTANAVITIVEK